MKDPPRLLHQAGDDLTRAVLRSARRDVGSNAARTRALAAMMAPGAVVATVTTAKAGVLSLKGGGVLFFKWLGMGVVLGTASVGVVVAVQPSEPPHSAAPRESAVSEPQPSRPVPRSPAALASVFAYPPTEPPAPAPAMQGRVRPAKQQSQLAAELRLLDRARQAIARGDGQAALEALAAWDAAHAGGALGPEAAVLQVEALLMVGQRRMAQRVAAPWIVDKPGSAHAKRMRRLLDAAVQSRPGQK